MHIHYTHVILTAIFS